MPNYLFVKKKRIINFREFCEIHIFWGGKIRNFRNLKKKKLPIYGYAYIIGNTHPFPLHNEPSRCL